MLDRKKRTYRVEVWDNIHYSFARFNDHQVRGAIAFAERLDESRLKNALDLSAEHAYPLIRCRLADNPFRFFWEDAGFSSADMFLVEETKNMDASIQARLCSSIDERSGPQVKVSLLRGPESDTLCVNMNHMLADGAGFKEFLYSLSDIYSRLGGNADYIPSFAMGLRDTHQIVRSFSLFQRAAGRMKRYSSSKYEKKIGFALEGNRCNPFVVTRRIERSEFLKVKAYAGMRGATVNDAFLAAYVRALHKLADGYVPAVQCVNDLRKYLPGKKPAAFCNLTSDMPCAIGPDIGVSFDDTLRKVKAAMDEEKNKLGWLSQIMMLESLFFLFPHRIARYLVLKNYRSPPIAMSNIGIIDNTRLLFGDAVITDAYMTGSIKYNPFLLLSLSTFSDSVTCCVGFHGTQADNEKIRTLLETIAGELLCR